MRLRERLGIVLHKVGVIYVTYLSERLVCLFDIIERARLQPSTTIQLIVPWIALVLTLVVISLHGQLPKNVHSRLQRNIMNIVMQSHRKLFGCSGFLLQFFQFDVIDESGILLCLKILYHLLAESARRLLLGHRSVGPLLRSFWSSELGAQIEHFLYILPLFWPLFDIVCRLLVL